MSDSENSEENEEFSDIDEDRPTLLQINRKIEKIKKEENLKTMIKKRMRSDNKTDIIYDANKKKLINCFCPNIEELNEFLVNCEIREIKDENELKQLNLSKENIFDPNEFIQKNCKNEEFQKSLLNIEDMTLLGYNEKLENLKPLEIKEEKYIPKSQIEDKSDLIKKILDSDTLDNKQRGEFGELLLKIKNINIKNVIKENHKLDIVFDLDNTCILGFTVTLEQYDELKQKFPDRDLKLFYFRFNQRVILSVIILRKGLAEFLEFTKQFCNFYISTLGVESYGIEVKLILEKEMRIKFKDFKGRSEAEKSGKKLLKDLNLDPTKTLIFDDKIEVWAKDFFNVIVSKKFTDEDFLNFMNKKGYEKMQFLMNYFPFNYFQFQKNKSNQICWKAQKFARNRACPFYKFIKKNDANNNCFFGEYLNSSKYQFNYMKNIIKIIYFLIFNYDIHAPDALKLIRYNIFFKRYFIIDLYLGEGKDILKDIIETCGGEIYDGNKIKKIKDEKIFIVCRKDDYNLLKEKIKRVMLMNNNSILVTEKFVVDCLFFMTNLENEADDPEYFFDLENLEQSDFNY